jgi:hypothetical protein
MIYSPGCRRGGAGAGRPVLGIAADAGAAPAGAICDVVDRLEPDRSILERLAEDPSWIRLQVTADVCGLYTAEQLEQDRRALGKAAFNREYLGIPGGDGVSPFGWDRFERATQIRTPLVSSGLAFQPAVAPAQTVPNPFQSLCVSGALR